MMSADPVLEINLADCVSETVPFRRLSFNSSSVPTSPKTRELKAKYEALRVTGIAQPEQATKPALSLDEGHRPLHK